MPNNYLVTGPPRCGKTTVLDSVRERLHEAGLSVGGVVCPEVRRSGERVGFELVDVRTGDRGTLASIDGETGPRVGAYRVAVDTVDDIAARALADGLATCDVLVIDEIAPMQVHSEAFVRGTWRALDAELPVVAAVASGPSEGVIAAVRTRSDATLWTVTRENRDAMPAELAERVQADL